MKTTTFFCTLNRTILQKTKSHSVYISNADLVDKLFGPTYIGRGETFYLRKEYYSESGTMSSYFCRLERHNSEKRLYLPAKAYNKLNLTETDNLIIEKVEADRVDRDTIFFINKKTVTNTLLLRKLNVIKDTVSHNCDFDTSANVFWTWDNSDNTEIWDNVLNTAIRGLFSDSRTASPVTFNIRNVGTVNDIICGDDRRANPRTQSKTIYEISVTGEHGGIPLNKDLYCLKQIGPHLIMEARNQSNTFSMFETQTVETEE